MCINMKKGIILSAYGGKNWIGGIYYTKNIVYMLSNNEEFVRRYNIYVFVEEPNAHIFDDLKDRVKLIVKSNREAFEKKFFLLGFYIKNNIRYIYPSNGKSLFPSVKSIAWIADFQHNYLPEMFKADEIQYRNNLYISIAKSNIALVLSSQTCKNDFEKFYIKDKKNVKVVRFISYIEPEIKQIDDKYEQSILTKYGLWNRKYVYIANQFWKHKNHIVVLNAIREFAKKHGDEDIKFIFTGQMEDYRNPEYIQEIKELINLPEIYTIVDNLGLIERREQIVIMKNAHFLIQPSLFEGWGTVVEDAKVLDKTIILSDIEVHREQKNHKCVLFNPYDAGELAELIYDEIKKEQIDFTEIGLEDMHKRAKEYSNEFLKLMEEY